MVVDGLGLDAQDRQVRIPTRGKKFPGSCTARDRPIRKVQSRAAANTRCSFFQGQNGKYWHVDSECVTADSDVPEGFYLELREPTRICIKSIHGEYLTASKNGTFRLGDREYENATKWEY